MPLVRIDLQAVHSMDRAREIADAAHRAVVQVLDIPLGDRFQIVNRLESGFIVADDAGLGFERSPEVVVLQIFTQRGRPVSTKQSLYEVICRELGSVGIAPEDVFIGYVENGPEDWSFGFGYAQYLTGELAVPAAK